MPNYYGQYPMYTPNAFQAGVSQTQQQAQPQIQNGGFVPVRSEDEARNYPIAPGTSVTFKNEVEPYVYTKTMGFSQLDRPIFDKYRLVKEMPENQTEMPQKETFDLKGIEDSLDNVKDEIEAIWKEIDGMKNVPVKKTNSRRKEDGGDD